MEERMIDDEYGRGIRLKKTADGYVDVTDEQLDTDSESAEEMELSLPVMEMDEDDEDLVGLSPEEALKLRAEKAERAKARAEEYARLCAEGNAFLEAEDFASAENSFASAFEYADEGTDASVGYWRAKTQNFANPDVLVDEYLEAGIENMEYEVGVEALDSIKANYRPALSRRYNELCAEEKPLAESWTAKHGYRKGILSARRKRAMITFLCVTLPMLLFGALTAVIGMKNFTTRENTFVLPTILLGVVTFGLFIAFVWASNRWLNATRMCRKNEQLKSTDEGRRLAELREYMELYGALLLEDAEGEEDVKNTKNA